MDSEKGYWKRQAYMLSSIGLFYIILIGLFAIPLLATFVVILIKGVIDLQYVIITAVCGVFVVLIVIAVKFIGRLWRRTHQDGAAAGEDIRRQLLLGKPVEVSIFNGMLKFSCGHTQAGELASLPHQNTALLPHRSDRDAVTDVVDQLQELSELKRSGVIDADEFNLLKTMLIESSTSACTASENDPS
jgi:hypothetical protein